MVANKNTWADVLKETNERKLANGRPDYDGVRRSKMAAVKKHTGRPLIVYAVDFLNLNKTQAAGGDISMDWSDKDGFMEVADGLEGDSVDVLLHSPGGKAEAADSIVKILRGNFDDVRFIIPNLAKSAATMLALSGDSIMMDYSSELGPIDPQFVFQRSDGSVVVAPAQAIIDQFDHAQGIISKEPEKLAPWLPILQQYGPSLYIQAKNAIELSQKYVEEWLSEYMFRELEDADAKSKARSIAKYLSSHNEFKSHSKKIGLDDIAANAALKPLKVVDMRKDPELRNHIWGLYNSIAVTFNGTGAYKIFENSLEQAMVKMIQIGVIEQKPEKKKKR